MIKLFFNIRFIMVLAIVFSIFIVIFNCYNLTVDKTYDTMYTAQDIEKLEVEKININTASFEQLCELPQVGEVIATRIIEYRTANNGFKSLQEIMNVKGIGEKTYLEIELMITI